MNKNWLFILGLMQFLLLAPIAFAQNEKKVAPIKIGWTGALTGPTDKWGASQAAILGIQDINSSGGINGRPLQVVFEDTGCNAKAAVAAFKKLTSLDNVKFILGGHCSPDSLAIAPLAEKLKIPTLGAISSSPKLSDQGDYIFRVTPVSTKLAELVAPYAYNKLAVKKIAMLYEQTDYVVPVAEKFETIFKELGGSISSVNSFNPGETDFRSSLIKASHDSDGIYLGVQAPDTALLLMKQIRDLGLKQIIIGNEQFGGAFLSSTKKEDKNLLDGVIFAEPVCDLNDPAVKSFTEKFKRANNVEALPFGCYTGEAYDTVQLLAGAVKYCGENANCVKDGLYKIQNYAGASGNITFNDKGDVQKDYLVKRIERFQVVALK